MLDFNLKNFLPYRLSILSQSVSHLIAKDYGNRFGLTMHQWRCLVIINTHQNVSAKDICTHSLLDKMTVSRALRALASRDLIKTSLATDDKRKRILKLTQGGRKIYEEILPLAKNRESTLLNALTAKEVQTLDLIITKLLNASNRQ